MFLFNHFAFGHKNAPTYFKQIMQKVVDKSDDVVVIYLQDIMIFRDRLDTMWKVVIQVIAKLTAVGFIINIKKCDFLIPMKYKCLGL